MPAAPPPDLSLRAWTSQDVRLLARVDSEFEDFGVPSTERALPGTDWGSLGGLVVVEGRAAGPEAAPAGAGGQETVLGSVSWYRPVHGPGEGSRVFGIGIGLLPGARGRGVGTWAQRELARLILLHTPANRVEASTDVENVAEQRTLERAGFTREGVLRGAQWRLGRWHDMVLYSVLRADVSLQPDRPAHPTRPAP